MIKPGQRKKRRGQEGGEGAALPPPARRPPGLGPNKNLETVANSRLVATCPSPALRLEPGAIEEGEPHVLLPLGSRVKSVWASWLPPVFKLVLLLVCLSVLAVVGGIKGEGGGGD